MEKSDRRFLVGTTVGEFARAVFKIVSERDVNRVKSRLNGGHYIPSLENLGKTRSINHFYHTKTGSINIEKFFEHTRKFCEG